MVGGFSLMGGLTAILIETTIAAKLGLSRSSDTFYVAYTIPYVILNVISATGRYSFVPFFASLEARHLSDELHRGFSYAVNILLLGLSGIALLGAVTAPLVIRAIAPGLAATQIELASQLCRWLFLIIVPAGVAEVFRSFLFSQHSFALASAAGFFRNFVAIACILFTFNRYGLYSIVLGYFAGYLLQLIMLGGQIAISFSVRYSWTLAESGKAFQNLRGAGTAQVLAALAWQGVVIVERIIASFLPPGTITALNWGFKILGSLADLLAGSVGTVVLPALSRAVAQREQLAERKTFQEAVQLSLILVTPCMVFCLLLDHNIMRLVFERGSFTADDTALMSMVFFYYSLSLLLYASFRILIFYLFARQEAWVFFYLSLLMYSLNAAFDLIYVGAFRLGAKGIPLGLLTALVVTSWIAFRRNICDLQQAFDRWLGGFMVKNLFAASLAAVVVWGLRSWLAPPRTGFQNFAYLCGVCGAGSLIYLVTLAVYRVIPLAQLATVWQRPKE